MNRHDLAIVAGCVGGPHTRGTVEDCVECAPFWPGPHHFQTPQVRVSPRRVMDVPDEPGAIGEDFEGCES